MQLRTFSALGNQDLAGLHLLARISKLAQLKYTFYDFLNPVCACNLDPESISHFLLSCHLFEVKRKAFLKMTLKLQVKKKNNLDQVLLHGSET